MKFQLGIEPQLKLNMEPAALEARDILPKFNKGLAPSFNAASRSEAAMKFQLRIEPQLKLNMEPTALEAGDILPKLYFISIKLPKLTGQLFVLFV